MAATWAGARFLVLTPVLEMLAVLSDPSRNLVAVVDPQPVILFIQRHNKGVCLGAHKQRAGAPRSRAFLPRQPCHELTHHVRAGLVEGQLALDGIARNNLGEHFVLPMEARPALEPQTEADISYFLRRQSNFSPRSSQESSFRFRSQMVRRHTDSAAR